MRRQPRSRNPVARVVRSLRPSRIPSGKRYVRKPRNTRKEA